MMKPFNVMCVGGSDTSGGAGIQADLKTVAFCGCWGLTVITAVTAQNTKGVAGICPVPPRFVEKQMHTVLSDIGIDALKTGMLPTDDIVRAVAKNIVRHRVRHVVVDPVMIAKGGKSLMNRKAKAALIETLLPLSFAVTPNIPEAEVLAKMEIKSLKDMKTAAVKIRELGPQNVLIKGGHLTGAKKKDVTDILYNGSFFEFSSERIPFEHTHGTGCTFASALAAEIAKGATIINAALRAKVIMIAAIKHSATPGKGFRSVNIFGENIIDKTDD